MITHELALPPDADLSRAAQAIEDCCAAAGLRRTLKGTLAKYPGCIHWHFKQGVQPGTLEITLWPAARRLWCPTRAGRTAPWVATLIAQLQPALAQALAGLSNE